MATFERHQPRKIPILKYSDLGGSKKSVFLSIAVDFEGGEVGLGKRIDQQTGFFGRSPFGPVRRRALVGEAWTQNIPASKHKRRPAGQRGIREAAKRRMGFFNGSRFSARGAFANSPALAFRKDGKETPLFTELWASLFGSFPRKSTNQCSVPWPAGIPVIARKACRSGNNWAFGQNIIHFWNQGSTVWPKAPSSKVRIFRLHQPLACRAGRRSEYFMEATQLAEGLGFF